MRRKPISPSGEGPEKDLMEKIRKDGGIGKNVRFTGHIENQVALFLRWLRGICGSSRSTERFLSHLRRRSGSRSLITFSWRLQRNVWMCNQVLIHYFKSWKWTYSKKQILFMLLSRH